MLPDVDMDIFLSAFKDLAPDDLEGLLALASTRTLETGEFYIREHSTTRRLAYIKKGLIRVFGRRSNSLDATIFLRWEGQFVAATDSIFLNRPSQYTYQALEATHLIEVDYTRAQPIIDANPRLSMVRNAILMQMLSGAVDRVNGFVLLSPEERYNKLVQEKPDVINRVPDKYIATLLGVTPISLSRIRRRLATTRRR